LVSRPEVIFADEPTGNLDSRSGADVLGFLRDSVREHGQTIVMVTHDPVAASYADRVIFLADGVIVDDLDNPTADLVLDRMRTLDTPADTPAAPAAESRATTDPTGRTPHPNRPPSPKRPGPADDPKRGGTAAGAPGPQSGATTDPAGLTPQPHRPPAAPMKRPDVGRASGADDPRGGDAADGSGGEGEPEDGAADGPGRGLVAGSSGASARGAGAGEDARGDWRSANDADPSRLPSMVSAPEDAGRTSAAEDAGRQAGAERAAGPAKAGARKPARRAPDSGPTARKPPRAAAGSGRTRTPRPKTAPSPEPPRDGTAAAAGRTRDQSAEGDAPAARPGSETA